MANKKAKKSKTMGKKDLKKTKGGTLNFATNPGSITVLKQTSVNGDLTVQKVDVNPGSLSYFK
jgi:hypothetical protein